jgi:4'-phosphopantetheinyl transferase EntD
VAHTERIATPHGEALILELDAFSLDDLPPEEAAHARTLGEVRRREFVTGRAALRSLLGAPAAILPDDRGAPRLPSGLSGSISHKGARAAAIVAPSSSGHVGIDLEHAQASRYDIGRRILTPAEQTALAGNPLLVTLHFAIKEAIYKAIDPIVRRYVGFTEVSLTISSAGACAVTLVDPARLPVVVSAWWTESSGHWLATALAQPA